MKTKDLIEIARGCERLKVSEKDGCTFIIETKRGGVGIVIWPDRSINRTDTPIDTQKFLRVWEAERLLGLTPKTKGGDSKTKLGKTWMAYRQNRRLFQ